MTEKLWVVVNESLEHGEHRCGVHRTRTGAYMTARGEIELYGEHYASSHGRENIESALKDLGDQFQDEQAHPEQFGGGDPNALFYVTVTLCEVGP